MCVVSMISNHYQPQWPVPNAIPAAPAYDILELMRKAAAYDKLTNQPDCVEKDKEEWIKALEQRVKGLEKRERGTVLVSTPEGGT